MFAKICATFCTISSMLPKSNCFSLQIWQLPTDPLSAENLPNFRSNYWLTLRKFQPSIKIQPVIFSTFTWCSYTNWLPNSPISTSVIGGRQCASSNKKTGGCGATDAINTRYIHRIGFCEQFQLIRFSSKHWAIGFFINFDKTGRILSLISQASHFTGMNIILHLML